MALLVDDTRPMQRRSVPNTLQLDQSLRSARNFYFVSSVIGVPCAMLSVAWLITRRPMYIPRILRQD